MRYEDIIDMVSLGVLSESEASTSTEDEP